MFDQLGEKVLRMWQKLDDLTNKASEEITKKPIDEGPD
jgi:hypothetical protein